MKYKILIIAILVMTGSIRTGLCQVNPADSLRKTGVDSLIVPGPISLRPVSGLPIHPYKINVWVSGTISVIGSVGDYFAIPMLKDKPRISDEELNALNTKPLTGLDKWALEQDPTKRVYFDHMSDNVITGIFILPLTLAFDKGIRHDGLKLLLMYYESQAVTFSIFNYSPLGPNFQSKFRPMAYYTDIPTSDRNVGNNRNSFFAGHVSSATSAAFFMAKVYSDYHPNIGAKKYLLYAAATLPGFAMSYLRVRALKHFPSDALVGMCVGAVCGVAIPSLHHVRNRNVNLGIFASPEGASGLTMNWNIK